MKWNTARTLFVGLVVCIAVVHILGLVRHLYFFIWWYDIPVHFFGGLWVGLGTLLWLSKNKNTIKVSERLMWIIGVTFIVGLGWEFFEWLIGQTSYPTDLIDSISDLVNDLLGALSTIFISIKPNVQGISITDKPVVP